MKSSTKNYGVVPMSTGSTGMAAAAVERNAAWSDALSFDFESMAWFGYKITDAARP